MVILSYLFAMILIVATVGGVVVVVSKVIDNRTSSDKRLVKDLEAKNAALEKTIEDNKVLHSREAGSLRETLNSIATGISADPQTEAKLALFNNYRRETF